MRLLRLAIGVWAVIAAFQTKRYRLEGRTVAGNGRNEYRLLWSKQLRNTYHRK